MVTAGILLVWLLLTLVAIVATAGWLGRLWRRREYLSLRTRIVDTVCAALVMAGALGTILGLVKAFGALGESVDSSRRTRILEEGVSDALNCTVFACLIVLPSFVYEVFITRRRRDPFE